MKHLFWLVSVLTVLLVSVPTIAATPIYLSLELNEIEGESTVGEREAVIEVWSVQTGFSSETEAKQSSKQGEVTLKLNPKTLPKSVVALFARGAVVKRATVYSTPTSKGVPSQRKVIARLFDFTLPKLNDPTKDAVTVTLKNVRTQRP